MAEGASDTILVAIQITLRIRESKVRNPDPPDRRRFVLSECFSFIHCVNCQSADVIWCEWVNVSSGTSSPGLSQTESREP